MKLLNSRERICTAFIIIVFIRLLCKQVGMDLAFVVCSSKVFHVCVFVHDDDNNDDDDHHDDYALYFKVNPRMVSLTRRLFFCLLLLLHKIPFRSLLNSFRQCHGPRAEGCLPAADVRRGKKVVQWNDETSFETYLIWPRPRAPVRCVRAES